MLPARSIAGQQPQGRPSITGIVFDSVAGRPLVGATVQVTGAAGAVMGRTASAVTDTAGRYTVANVAPGRYVAGFFHDALDTLGLVGEPRAVDVSETPAILDLATPSPRTISGTICGTNAVADSLGMLIGHIYRSGTSSPISGATVTVEWGET